jgi:hemerythrin-like domain-containing protein
VADAVLTVDRLDRLADAVEIARHARRIAVQSALVGMGLALGAMGFAAGGLLPPVAGAFLQEGIDVVVILNALRALRGGVRTRPLPPETEELLNGFAAEHQKLRDTIADLRATADRIATTADAPESLTALRGTQERLTQQVLPHEQAEEQRLYPAMAGRPESGAATSTMSRTHVEIDRYVNRIDRHLQQASDSRLRTEQLPDLLATLYGLDALLRLHFTQQEEDFFSLVSADGPGGG